MGPDLTADDAWKIYLTTDDIAGVASRSEALGAEVRSPVVPVADLGGNMVLTDPTGATVGAWQPGTFPGFTALNEPGAPSWFELFTRDFTGALEFYRTVFHWKTQIEGDTDEFRYATLCHPETDEPLAGVMDASSFLPDGVPAHWSIYWDVADVDAAVATVVELGGGTRRWAETHPVRTDGHGDRPLRGPVQVAYAAGLTGRPDGPGDVYPRGPTRARRARSGRRATLVVLHNPPCIRGDPMPIATVNPTTGVTEQTFEEISDEEVEHILARAAATFVSYRTTSFEQRAAWMIRAAEILEDEVERVATVMTTEMGKTLVAARAEVLKCAKTCRYMAERSESFLSDEPADAAAVGATSAYARWQPLGPVLAVMPWNFPLWQAMRFAAPALMAGNVGLLKHASNVPQSALFMQELFERAGFPVGAFQTLLISASRVEGVIRDDRVVAVTLTGSGPAGSSVAAIAGEVFKKSVLELGGSDPFIVMPSADVPRAAVVATTARCLNNGQSCIAAKRFIAHVDVADEFERLFVAEMSAQVVGDPMDPGTAIGPLASAQQQQDMIDLVEDAVAKGATVLCGGVVPDGPGYFYPPTVLVGITPEMRLHTEEAFGPVATLYRVADIDEAIELANTSEFGLGSNAWTRDAGEQARFVADLEAGMVFLNGNTTSFPELPFGGIKSSGYGRELTAHGIREFCNLKSVWVGE